MSEKYDAIVIGMGPSGIFFAYELIQLKKAKNILLIDQGKRVENRNCPIEKVGKCVKCQPYCNITSGFSGAGAFSDGKLSLYNDEDDDIYVGGILQEYIGVENTKRLIDYTDDIYLKFGADTKVYGVDKEKEIIKKHMWPLTFSPPKYLESFIVTIVDKYCAFKEWSIYCAFYILKIA